MIKVIRYCVMAAVVTVACLGTVSCSHPDSAATAGQQVAAPKPPTASQIAAEAAARSAARAKANHAWQAANHTHTVDGYKAFAARYPSDPRAATARDYAAHLAVALAQRAREEAARKAWLHAQRAATGEAYQDFADTYPNDPHAAQARHLINNEGISLAEAVRRGWVSAHVSGEGLQSVSLTVDRVIHRPLQVDVPAGTYFVSNGGDAQDMVACQDTSADLTGGTTSSIDVTAACADFYRAQPSQDNGFSIRDSHPNALLRKLLSTIGSTNPDQIASQLAIWSITDDPTRDEVDEHIMPAPDTDDFTRAAHLLREAGIKPSSRQMFQDL